MWSPISFQFSNSVDDITLIDGKFVLIRYVLIIGRKNSKITFLNVTNTIFKRDVKVHCSFNETLPCSQLICIHLR